MSTEQRDGTHTHLIPKDCLGTTKVPVNMEAGLRNALFNTEDHQSLNVPWSNYSWTPPVSWVTSHPWVQQPRNPLTCAKLQLLSLKGTKSEDLGPGNRSTSVRP